jgi:hypothetical protein
MCKHARWRGSQPVGCLRFENSVGGADMAIVMQALLWQIADSQKCVARERLVVGPDAYLALDLPDRE